MELLVQLKTGFFEKRPYRLKAEDGSISLIPIKESGAEVIFISEGSILSVTLMEGRLPELEIQTRNEMYTCIINGSCSIAEAIKYLKEYLNINITCEYKGGEKNA